MKQKILLTGKDGFIGNYLFSRLKELGHKVVGISKDECDITKKEDVFKLFKKGKFNVVFHLAAFIPERGEDKKDFNQMFLVNVLGTLNFLEASKRYKVKKFIYSSSASVYNREETPMLTKEEYASPKSVYGLTKLFGENLCGIFYKNYNLSTVSLRYSSVFGYGQRLNSVLPIFMHKAFQDKNIDIFGEGERSQDFIYVKDVVEANIKAGFSGAQGVFNIGSGKGTSMMELAKIILKVFHNSKSKIVKKQLKSYDKSHFFLNIKKAKKELGFKPKYSLEKALKEYKEMIYENRHNS